MLLTSAMVVLVLLDGPANDAVSRLGWIDRDDSFTELYFPDHLSLPDSVAPGEPLAFDFSIRNREGSTTSYTWQVTVSDAPAPAGGDPDATVVVQGEQRLSDGDAAVVRVERAADVPLGPAVVSVALVGRTEAIHFPIVVEDVPPVD